MKEHNNFKGFNNKVKAQAKELGKEFKEVVVNNKVTQNKVNDTSKQQGIGRY
ncbi:hypothetical protein [Wolbachia endosymbiont of Ctenocephalides felis wCfeT]|uniref:hypothetical protein n=1 Tax=Wolbachia endosymbiont of Ctenocephalides felis wCfeT TaxID=2732593 RepID=UPI0014454CA9|nr:hypothetical protein [Wolbachia endosymbiont of Ctenocephalides felis wCfeT]